MIKDKNKITKWWIYKITSPSGRVYIGVPIYKYNLLGELMAEYGSIAEAVEKTGIKRINIATCLIGYRRHTHGYIFKYKLNRYAI